MPLKEVAVALDWTPNGNHVGFYVAKAKGWFADHGLAVALLSPHADGYAATPAQKVEAGDAILGVAPSETVLSYALRPAGAPARAPLVAVAAVLQADDSAIVAPAPTGIDRPRKLDGRRYASYGARFEGRIVRELIKADGGTGEYDEVPYPMLDCWAAVQRGDADATWVFSAWEVAEAKAAGMALHAFRLADFGIPYGYAPVLVARADAAAGGAGAETLRAVLAAAAAGFKFAAEHPAEAAALMLAEAAREHPGLALDAALVTASVAGTAHNLLGPGGAWGVMEAGRWTAFVDWLSAAGLLTTALPSRAPVPGVSASLDDLRSGGAGEAIPREAIDERTLWTNALLP